MEYAQPTTKCPATKCPAKLRARVQFSKIHHQVGGNELPRLLTCGNSAQCIQGEWGMAAESFVVAGSWRRS